MRKLWLGCVVVLLAGIGVIGSEERSYWKKEEFREQSVSTSVENEFFPLEAETEGVDLETEKKQLLATVEHLFLQLAPAVINPEHLTPMLVKVNEQGKQAVAFMLEELRAPPIGITKLRVRMAIVDYFRYRMNWDKDIIEPLVAYIEREISSSISLEAKAIILADKAELLGGLATVDRELARQVASKIEGPVMRSIACYEIYHGLLQDSADPAEALDFIHSFNAGFEL